MPEEKNKPKMPHSVILENRKLLNLSGISDVDSFNEQTITAYTSMGELTIRGTDLHINKLNLETGELIVEGEICAMIYSDHELSGKSGIFSKLFR